MTCRPVAWAMLAAVIALASCQSTDALYLTPEAPLGSPGLTGQTPQFEANPTGAVAQLTPSEKAAIRSDLQAATAPAARQAAADNAGAYRQGIAQLQKQGDALTQERLRRIEASSEVSTATE